MRCSQCGALIEKDALFCAECGAGASAGSSHVSAPLVVSVSETQPLQEPARRTKICRFCAEEILEAAARCKHCGADLRGPWYRRRGIQKATRSLAIFLITVGLVLVAAATAGLLSGLSEAKGRGVTIDWFELFIRGFSIPTVLITLGISLLVINRRRS